MGDNRIGMNPFTLSGPARYDERAAKSWLKSLKKAGREGFRMEAWETQFAAKTTEGVGR